MQGTAAGGNGIVNFLWVTNAGKRGKADIQNTPIAPGAPVNWIATVPLGPGANHITMIAVDRNNKSATAGMLVHNTAIAPIDPTSPGIHSALWRGRNVTYEVIDGMAVAEGDMILGTAAELENPRSLPAAFRQGERSDRRLAIDYTSLLWPNVGGIVQILYVITAGGAAAPAIAAFNASLAG